MKELMQSIFSFVFIVIFSSSSYLIDADHLSRIEHDTLEYRVKHAETILFGRFHWLLPITPTDDISQVYSLKQNTFEFLVYCTIKKTRIPTNVPHVIRVTIENEETEIDMKKNRWFVLFPKQSKMKNLWSIDNRTDALDLDDDLKLHQFEQFCFLNPKLPFGFPSNGLLNRCPRPSSEHCLRNGTRIRHDDLLELKTFLTSSTTRPMKTKRTSSSSTTEKVKQYIGPVW